MSGKFVDPAARCPATRQNQVLEGAIRHSYASTSTAQRFSSPNKCRDLGGFLTQSGKASKILRPETRRYRTCIRSPSPHLTVALRNRSATGPAPRATARCACIRCRSEVAGDGHGLMSTPTDAGRRLRYRRWQP
jgi:hypothetical protein